MPNLLQVIRRLFSYGLIMFTLLACRGAKSFAGRESNLPTISFAGRNWAVKNSNEIQGPGDNLFSADKKNLYKDLWGNLHLRIEQEGQQWHCAEIICLDTLGYGRYSFTIKGQLSKLDPYAVFGLFTWDDESFQTQANSEIDIEFSRWGYPLGERILHYSIHPVSNRKLFLERMHQVPSEPELWDGVSTHIIEWRDTAVSFTSFPGRKRKDDTPLFEHHYSFQNPARRKEAYGRESEAIQVPKPGKATSARINLWLMTGKDRPLSGKAQEVVIKDFKFERWD